MASGRDPSNHPSTLLASSLSRAKGSLSLEPCENVSLCSLPPPPRRRLPDRQAAGRESPAAERWGNGGWLPCKATGAGEPRSAGGAGTEVSCGAQAEFLALKSRDAEAGFVLSKLFLQGLRREVTQLQDRVSLPSAELLSKGSSPVRQRAAPRVSALPHLHRELPCSSTPPTPPAVNTVLPGGKTLVCSTPKMEMLGEEKSTGTGSAFGDCLTDKSLGRTCVSGHP